MSLANVGINQTVLADFGPLDISYASTSTSSSSGQNITSSVSNSSTTSTASSTSNLTTSIQTTNIPSPSIALNPTSGSVGLTVYVTGSGFSTSDSSCSLSDGGSIAPQTQGYSASETCAITDGSVSASFVVADVAAGSYTIYVTGSPMNDSASATLTITSLGAASITLSPNNSTTGATVQVSGSNFPSTDSSCSISGSAVTAPSCSIGDGILSGSFIVANVTAGSYTVTIMSSPSGDSASAIVTVGAPLTTETSTTSTNSSSLTSLSSDFILTSTSNVTLTQGENASVTVYVVSMNGFNATVALSASWVGTAPEGLNLSIASSLTPLPNGTVTVPLTITASSTAPIGTFAVQVTGTSGSLTRVLGSTIAVQVLPAVSAFNGTMTSITTSTSTLPTVCPISSATSGSTLAPLAQALRTFRDQSVMRTRTGMAFLTLFNAWYYSFNPRLAIYIGSHQTQRTMLRYSLYPLIGVLYASYYSYLLISPFNSEVAAVTSGVVAAVMIGVAYLALPLYLAKRVSKRKTVKSSLSKAAHLLVCSAISGVAVGIASSAKVEFALGIAAASLILSTLTLGTILGSLALSRIEIISTPARQAILNRVLMPARNYAIHLASRI